MVSIVRPSQLSFSTVCDFYEACHDARSHTKKMALLRQFREKCIKRNCEELFEIYRLLLPQYDNKRGNFALKESKLATCWSNACGYNPRTSARGKNAVAWKASTTDNAGNFSAVMNGYLFRLAASKVEHDPGERELKVEDVNNKLNELAAVSSAEEKTAVLQWLVQHSSPRMLTWITHIVLKDLKIGISDKSILRDFHPDAEDLYNVTMDLTTVCTDLKDRNKRMPRRDVEPGRPVRSQLASAAKSPDEAFRRMKNKSFVVETKFDGERMQLHRNGDNIQYFSRRGVEHGEYSGYDIFDVVVKKQLKHEKCILDGEMIVWNKARKVFEPFGGLKSAFTAARDGRSADTQIEMTRGEGLFTADPDYTAPIVGDIELVFIAFDILFVGEESIINRPLLERQDVLKAAIAPPAEEGSLVGRGTMNGRMVKLIPNEPLLDHTICSKICHSMEDIQTALDEATRVQEEGIIVKALDSLWQMNDRSNAWLKIKPDYVHSNEIDAVIIGAFYGTGRHGGQVTQWLLALAKGPEGAASSTPSTFLSFCKVGNGMTDAELQTVREKLNPYFVPYSQKPKNYKVTASKKVQPDMWVKDVSKSIVLQVQADVRTIISRDFATRHSLRFPRVERIRYDKSPYDVQTDQQLWDLVNQNKGGMIGGESQSAPQPRYKNKKKSSQVSPQEKRKGTVVEHFLPTDVSSVKQESVILKGCKIQFLNYGTHSKAEMEGLVARLGGTVYQHWTKDVTHIIASQKDAKFQAHVKQQRDVVSLEWLLECEQDSLLKPIKPHHYLHLSKKTLQEVPDVCRFGDLYYVNVAPCDVQAVLENHCSLTDIDITKLPLLVEDHHDDDSLALPSTPHQVDPGHPVMRTSLEVIMDVEAELAQHGYADPSASLFRGCRTCLLTVPVAKPPNDCLSTDNLFQSTLGFAKAAGLTQEALQECQAKRAALQVQLHGGLLQQQITADTTHIMLLDSSMDRQILKPEELLEAASQRLGGVNALRHLKKGLAEGNIKLVAQSWLEASLIALEQDPAAARRADESQHPLGVKGAATDSSDGPNYRSAGWPWGQFGVVDEPSPKRKKQATSHHKRSTSPASRTTSRKSVAGAAPDDEVSKPPAKRAKRTARVGAAKVVKRGPGRRGKATALGAATSTGNEQKGSRKEQDAGNEHAEASSDKSVQPEQAKVSSARDTEEDADWQPGKSSQQANVPETGSKKRKPPPRQTSKQAPRKATRAKRTKQTPAHDSTSQDSGDSSMHQGVIDLDAVHSKAQHKRQVLEDEDIVMTTEDASPQNGDGDGAVSSIKHVAAATSDEAPREDRQSRAAGSALDRITALDSILSHVAQAPQNADANPPITDDVKPKANMSLLDAMMADDDFEYAAQCSTEQHEQSNSAPATEDLATTVPHTQQDPQLDANKGDGTEHGIAGQLAPLAKKHATSVDVKTVASPTSLKGSLRARMKALGMASK